MNGRGGEKGTGKQRASFDDVLAPPDLPGLVLLFGRSRSFVPALRRARARRAAEVKDGRLAARRVYP
jgi:hypothetical protein